MASAIKVCRICGKEYEACRSANRSAGVFRWQEVACSPECGAAYLEKINESRGLAAVSAAGTATVPKKNNRKKEIPQPEAEPTAETVSKTVIVESESNTSVENE